MVTSNFPIWLLMAGAAFFIIEACLESIHRASDQRRFQEEEERMEAEWAKKNEPRLP